MTPKTVLDVPDGMQKIYQRFERWRSSHQGRLPIPKANGYGGGVLVNQLILGGASQELRNVGPVTPACSKRPGGHSPDIRQLRAGSWVNAVFRLGSPCARDCASTRRPVLRGSSLP